jgi:hypothetical protein
MHGAKPVNTPMATGPLLSKLSSEPFVDPHFTTIRYDNKT